MGIELDLAGWQGLMGWVINFNPSRVSMGSGHADGIGEAGDDDDDGQPPVVTTLLMPSSFGAYKDDASPDGRRSFAMTPACILSTVA